MKKAVIFDIDGTLSNIDHRVHYLKDRNWDDFFKNMDKDTLIESTYLLNVGLSMINDLTILIVTGRPDNYKETTMKWLALNQVSFDELHMRKAGDYRPDTVVKEEILTELRKKYKIVLAIEDRRRVVDMWRNNLVDCFQCADHDF